MASIRKEEYIGVAFALLSILANSLTPVMGRFSIGNYPPVLFAAARATIGFAVLYAYLLAKGRGAGVPFQKPRADFALTGIFSTGMASLLIFLGMQTTRAMDAALLLQIEIPYSLIISYFLVRERITKKQLAFTAMVFAGVLAVVFKGGVPALGFGPLLVLAAPFFWPLGSSFAKKLMKKYDPFTVVCERLLYGALFLFAASFVFEGAQAWGYVSSPQFLAASIFQGLFIFVIGNVAWYMSLSRINLSKATGLIGLAPALTFFFSWLLLGETASLPQFAGLFLVVCGTYLLSTQVKSESRQAANL